MPQHVPWVINVTDHPGSSEQEVRDEPDWIKLRTHSIGFKDREGRKPGIAHPDRERQEEIEEARRLREELSQRESTGDLVNFRDVIRYQTDLHLHHPEDRSLGWRYVLETTEDWVKSTQKWPANLYKWEQEEEEEEKKKQKKRAGEEERQNERNEKDLNQKPSSSGEAAEEDQPELAAQERALLAALRHESRYMASLKQNDGRKNSPQIHNRSSITIDEQDQFTPDNWLPRCPDLIRLTGKHPLNAEPPLARLFDGGLITPNELHFVRNHGSVPRLLWEFHRLDIEHPDGRTALSLTMDQLKDDYADSVINIPVAMACTGNRRKELNLRRKTKGANNAAGSVGCAYWRGPTVRSVLLSAGIPEHMDRAAAAAAAAAGEPGKRYWVHFAGADAPSEGVYETSLPFEHVMDAANDVLLALYMNDLPLPPDHGYPVRLMVPGWVGGRCVKWLRRIWISDRENESYYHVWDNRVVPPFVRSREGELAEALFRHPSTKCNEQVMNSVICKPAQGERVVLKDGKAGDQYRIRGFAYNGSGIEVQQVEVSIDDGESWLMATREYPEYPIRHGTKFWTWLFWQVDVDLAGLMRAPSVMVRCSDAAKNIQPRESKWNLLGMMNSSWYTVKLETVIGSDTDLPAVVFRHPTEPASMSGGWMKPSEELLIAQAKQEGAAPKKQFTREEIEKHDKEDDCWIVVDNKVFDVTSVLAWHPGGKSAIMAHAGKCHHETTEEFASIHDDFGYQKLQECILGIVTEKAAKYIRLTAEEAAKEQSQKAQAQGEKGPLLLQKHRWVPVKLVDRRAISGDTRVYTFEMPPGKSHLGLGTCQHIQVGFHFQDKMVVRSYTPTWPIVEHLPSGASQGTAAAASRQDKQPQHGFSQQPLTPPDSPVTASKRPSTFNLTVKTYFPTEAQPGGAMSNLLDCMPLGEEVEIRGPTGDIVYLGNSEFLVSHAAASQPPRKLRFPRVSLVLGGSGVTPGYALMAHIAAGAQRNGEGEGEKDKTQVRVVDANRTEEDILLRTELDRFEKETDGRVKVVHVLSRAGEGWKGEKGRVDRELLRRVLFPPGEGSAVFLCGPPGLVQKAALPALKEWGYAEDENMFGF
ncbi:hypothetical protein VTK26DRAFT_5856 [Humicola hyalothermophila]